MTLVDHLPLTEQRQIIMTQKKKLKKIKELISTGQYDEDIAKYIPNLLELKFQGMLEDIDTILHTHLTLTWSSSISKYY